MLDCETCVYYDYDETEDMYFCSVDMDEDDFARLRADHGGNVRPRLLKDLLC